MTVATAATERITGGRRARLVAGLALGAAVLVLVAAASIALGSRSVDPRLLLDALFGGGGGSADATVIREMRLPRTLLGILVGAALALGGVLLQGVARNPLADGGIMGINAGAGMAIAVGVVAFGLASSATAVWFAFAGAAVATVVVYAIAAVGREGATPVKLALAGAAVTALTTSVTSALILADPDALDELRRWQVGSLAGRYAPVLADLAPYLLVGIVAALFAGRALNLLSLGDDLARSLGLPLGPARFAIFAIVTVVCGAATAACGPIAFVGLAVAHLARLIVGPDYRWILAYAAVLGPILLVACDILGRIILPSGEAPVGVVVGVIGAPVFILLVRRRRTVEL